MAKGRKAKQAKTKLNMIIYGDTFTGKTTLASQIAFFKREDGTPFRVLYIDAESGGLDSYLDRMEAAGVNLDNIYILYTQSLTEVRQYIVKVKNNEDLYELDDEGNENDDIVTDADGTPKRDVYICMDASLLTTDMNAAKTRYKKVAAQVTYTASSWKYISKCFVDPALGIMVPTEAKAGSTTGFCNGLYTDSGTSGQREWLSLGNLGNGTICGLWLLYAYYGVGHAGWYIVSGFSRNRHGI